MYVGSDEVTKSGYKMLKFQQVSTFENKEKFQKKGQKLNNFSYSNKKGITFCIRIYTRNYILAHPVRRRKEQKHLRTFSAKNTFESEIYF